MTVEEADKARRIVSEWFWQPDSWHRKSLVRYYESAPIQPDVLRLVISFLKTEETDRISFLNKELDLGETWKATDAWFQTVPSEKWSGTESSKVRVYQSFKPKGDESDGPYVIEDGCQYKVSHRFHWDVAEIPAIEASASGVQHVLQGVTRDKETGLYSCVVETRERVRQDVAIYRSSGSVFETVSEEQHLGVKASDVASTGLQASAGNGIVVTRRLQKNADCTTDVVNTKTVENSRPNSIVSFDRTLRSTRTTKTDRNQASALSASGIVVGERRTSRMTDGGRYDNETVKTSVANNAWISQSCEKTVFEHTDTTTLSQATAPSAEASEPSGGRTVQKRVQANDEGSFDVTQTEKREKNVKNAVVVFRKTLRGTVVSRTEKSAAKALDDKNMSVGETRRSEITPGGLSDNTVELANGAPAGVIGVTCERQTSVHVHTVSSNVKEKPSDDVDAAPGITVRRQSQLNDMGTWDVVETTAEYSERVASAVGGSVKALQTIVVRNDAKSAAVGEEPEVNKDVSVDVSKTERGTYNLRTVVTRHVPTSVEYSFGTMGSGVSVKTSRNDTEKNVEESPAVNRSVEASVTPNDHGSFDKTVRVVAYNPMVSVAQTNWQTETIRTTTVRHSTDTSARAEMGDASSEPDENGAATTRVSEYTPRLIDSGWILWQSKVESPNSLLTFQKGIRVFKNLTAIPKGPGNGELNISAGINKYGRYDGSMTYSELLSWEKNAKNDDTGGIGASGVAYGPTYVLNGVRWHSKYRTRSFYGSGHEGTLASAMASASKVASGGGVTVTWEYIMEEKVR